MTLIALILLLTSSILHACWNLLTKGRKLGIDIFMASFFFGGVAFLPFIIIGSSNFQNLITKQFILYLLVSSLFQSAYHVALIKSYANKDLSFAYPLIRSIPVLIIALIQLVFFKAMLGPFIFVGIFMIITGTLILPIHDSFKRKRILTVHSHHIFIAVLGTVGYTLIDARALSLMSYLVPENSILMRTIIWASLQNGVDFVYLLIYTLMTKKNNGIGLKKINWHFVIFMTIAMNATHLLVLGSMHFVRDVSYVYALRQLSIPIGALFGFIFLKEKPYKYRIIGVSFIFIGIVFVALK